MSRYSAVAALVHKMGHEMGVRADMFISELDDTYEVRVTMPIIAPRVKLDPQAIEDVEGPAGLAKLLVATIERGRVELFGAVIDHMEKFE